jgi:hypothetical protein
MDTTSTTGDRYPIDEAIETARKFSKICEVTPKLCKPLFDGAEVRSSSRQTRNIPDLRASAMRARRPVASAAASAIAERMTIWINQSYAHRFAGRAPANESGNDLARTSFPPKSRQYSGGIET